MNLDHLTDDLRAAEGRLGNLRWELVHARRRGDSLGGIEFAISVTERQAARLGDQINATWAAIDKLCADITDLAQRALPHDAEETRLLALLGCNWVDADVYPYVDAALRMREEPSAEHMTAFVVAREILLVEGRVAA